MDAQGLIGRDKARSGKREGRFYAMKGTAAKENHTEPKVFFEKRVGGCANRVFRCHLLFLLSRFAKFIRLTHAAAKTP
jgi:hypothetical protein